MVDEDAEIAAARHWYADDLRLRAPVRRNMAIVEAFAAVPRERFLGAAPWIIQPDRFIESPFAAPDADVRWLYHDVLVSIDPARKVNNGQPSFWARNFDHLDLRHGRRILQVGAGTGYYAAILAEIVGPDGRVVAVEHDGELALRARANLGTWPQVEVVAGDGRAHDPGEVDTIIVFAGATHPAALWLERLAPGGELLLPLTGDDWWGFLLRVMRGRDDDARSIVLPEARTTSSFAATSIGGVGIFPCAGGRDEVAAKRLTLALQTLSRGASSEDVPIETLHRGDPAPQDMDRVWYRGPGFWLERRRMAGGK